VARQLQVGWVLHFPLPKELNVQPSKRSSESETGRSTIGLLLLWLIGVPLPIILIIYFLSGGCG
jgi:hypothetical protein